MTEEKKETKTSEQDWKTPVTVIGIIVGIALIIGAVILSNSNATGNVVSEDSQNNQIIQENSKRNCRQEQVPYEEQETYYETVPYTDQECETKQLVYSIENTKFDYEVCNQEEEECIDYFLGICTETKHYCIDKSVACSLNIKNLDNEGGGSWTITHSFYETGTENLIDSQGTSKYLYPQSTQTIQNILKIQSQGEEGKANKNIGSCNYQISKIPTKQVCRDVIKYKDVPRTRIVTKYKTEEVCN